MATADRELAERIEELVLRVGRISDLESREAARQLMAAILELHGAGLARIVEITSGAGEPGQALIRGLANDNLVGALLLLHNLHPDDVNTRVRRALGKWRGSAELAGEFEGVIRIRLSASGCGMKEAVEAAVREAAPDALEIVVEEGFAAEGFVPLAALGMSISGVD